MELWIRTVIRVIPGGLIRIAMNTSRRILGTKLNQLVSDLLPALTATSALSNTQMACRTHYVLTLRYTDGMQDSLYTDALLEDLESELRCQCSSR